MKKVEFLEQLKELTSTENIVEANREVNELKIQFEDFILEEERLRQVAYLEAKDKGEEAAYETNVDDPIRNEFYEVYNSFREARTTILNQIKKEQEENYAIKRTLLERLRSLVEKEENIKVSYDVSTEIHEKWKETGEVPREKRQEVYAEYSRLRDMFFTNLSIYKELREYDLKKNQQIKEEIIEKVKALSSEENIKHVEDTLKALQGEFDETGPVPREEWERIRDEYWGGVRAVYQKIHDFYDNRRQQLQENIDKKTELLAVIKTFVSENVEHGDAKSWEKATKELLEYQEQWRNIGYGLKKQNEELWTALREQCDVFFENKRKFYERLKTVFEKNAAKKQSLIDEIDSLKDNTEWKTTSNRIIQLQKQWKQIGHAGQKNEQVLWKKFRGACDHFFNAKDAYFKELDAAAEGNLKAKEAVIEKIQAYQPGEDRKQVLNDLKAFASEYAAIGKVPFKVKDKIYAAYKQAIDAHYTNLKLEGAEKEKVLFQAQIDNFKAAPNSEDLIDKLRRDLNNQVNTLRQAVIQYENNLGFFSNADTTNPIIMDINKNIKVTKDKITQLQLKIKLLNE